MVTSLVIFRDIPLFLSYQIQTFFKMFLLNHFLSSRAKDADLFTALSLRWKRQKFVLNPTFSSLKLKQMSPLIHSNVEILMKKMAEQCVKGEPYDIFAYFKRFTMDTIWSCGFGLDTDIQNNVDEPYLLNTHKMFSRNIFRGIIFILSILITELTNVWRCIFQVMNIIRYCLRRCIPITK